MSTPPSPIRPISGWKHLAALADKVNFTELVKYPGAIVQPSYDHPAISATEIHPLTNRLIEIPVVARMGLLLFLEHVANPILRGDAPPQKEWHDWRPWVVLSVGQGYRTTAIAHMILSQAVIDGAFNPGITAHGMIQCASDEFIVSAGRREWLRIANRYMMSRYGVDVGLCPDMDFTNPRMSRFALGGTPKSAAKFVESLGDYYHWMESPNWDGRKPE